MAYAGVNVLLVAANPKVFEQVGVDLPDDSTLTWVDWAALSAEITAKGKGIIGSSDFTLYDLGIWMFLRHKGKDLYTADGPFDLFYNVSMMWSVPARDGSTDAAAAGPTGRTRRHLAAADPLPAGGAVRAQRPGDRRPGVRRRADLR